jgi:hypothetical protein
MRRIPPASSSRIPNEHALAYVYFENEPGRRAAANLLRLDRQADVHGSVVSAESRRAISSSRPRPAAGGAMWRTPALPNHANSEKECAYPTPGAPRRDSRLSTARANPLDYRAFLERQSVNTRIGKIRLALRASHVLSDPAGKKCRI